MSQQVSLRRRTRAVLTAAVAGVVALSGSPVKAVLTWDPLQNQNAAAPIVGGAGIWDTSSAFWSDGTADVAWPVGGDIAVFGGTKTPPAGTVTISNGGAGVTATGLTFSLAGYTIAGTETLTLSGPVTLTQGALITAPLAGSGAVTVTAPAAMTLTLGNARTVAAGPFTNNTGFTGSISAGTNATVLVNAPLAATAGYGLAGGTVRLAYANAGAAATAGTAGLNAFYYNFGSNPNATTNPQQYAVDQLYINRDPRVVTRVEANVNLPNPGGNGTQPVLPILGLGLGAVTGGVQDGFMLKGLLNINAAGSYQFSGTNDDNLILYIDGQQVGTLGVVAANTNLGTPVNLTAGAHSFVLKQSQGTGGGYATLSYNGPDSGNATTIVPASAFTTGTLAASQIGPINLTASSTLDVGGPTAADSLTTTAAATLTLTSPTIDSLTVTGPTTLGGTLTVANTTGALVLAGPVGQTAAAGLTFNGPYLSTLGGTNTYTGTTTVAGGELDLAAAGGNAVPTNLTITAANANGLVRNVRLLAADQIADTATVALSNQAVLDLGAFNDTVGNLTMTGGQILGTGTLTLAAANPTLGAGTIAAGLGGNFTGGLTKNGTGTLVLAGNSSFTGVATVAAGGTLNARNANALGAAGPGNETFVNAGGTLELQGNALSAEAVTINGVGTTVLNTAGVGALRNVTGTNSLGAVTLATDATIEASGGLLRVVGVSGANLLVQGTGNFQVNSAPATASLAKAGTGAFILGYDTGGTIPAFTSFSGVLGFDGPQSFGSVTVGGTGPAAATTWRFNSDPGSGTVNVPAGNTVVAGFNPTQTFVNRLAGTGTLALSGDSAAALSFAGANLSLGSAAPLAYYTGALTPNGSGYKLGGGGGQLEVDTVLAAGGGLAVNGDVRLNGTNTFSGAVTVNAGGIARITNNSNLGAAANSVTLTGGGVLQFNQSPVTAGSLIGTNGNVVGPGDAARVITVGAGGGTIDVPASGAGGPGYTLNGTNALVGSGPLTKSGLAFLFVTGANTYSGALTLAANGNQTDLRGLGALPNVASLTINQAATLNVDNTNGLGSGRQGGAFAGSFVANRVNDTAPITLAGGTILFTPRGAAAQLAETFGPVTLGVGQDAIAANSNPTGTVGAVLTFGALTRQTGSTLRFGGTAGTFGAGTAGAPGANNTQVTFAGLAASNVLGFATQFGTNFVSYSTTLGVANPTLVTTTTAAGFVAANVADQTGDVTLTGANEVNAFRMTGGAARNLLFTAASESLAVTSGGVLSDGSAFVRNIGSATVRGNLTAGPASGNTVPRELFLHNNANTMTVFSTVTDNGGQAVSVVKDLDGTVVLDAPSSTYSGGTFVTRGTVTVSNTGGLGTGGVTVKNAILNLANKGATSSAAGYAVVDGGEVVLTNGTAGAAGAYDAAGDRFNFASGTVLYANSPGAGFGLNSLTRVSTLTAGGQAVLAPGAIVRHNMTNAPDQGTGILTVKNLGTNADLFFSPGNNGGDLQTVTVGAGTPWAGISSERGDVRWAQGTIFANSDFTFQGLTRDGGFANVILGQASTGTSYQIVNNAGRPINAFVTGQLIMDEDNAVSLPGDLTFVITSGGQMQPNRPQSLGFAATNAGNAKITVQAGGTLDPGNFVLLGAAANQATATLQNLPYPVPSPVSGNVRVEAGGRFVINDASGIGSAAVGSWLLKTDSVLEVGGANAFYGRGSQPFGGPVDTTGLIQQGQFVFEPGVVVRVNADNVYRFSQFVTGEANGDKAVIELVSARTVTNQNNPFLIPVVGTPTIAPENLTIGNGGVLTNDSADRQLNEGRGRLVLQNGAVLAGTTQTYLNLQEGLDVAGGATVTIGSTRQIDGVSKLGGVQLLGPNSNVIPASATVNLLDGTQLAFGAVNVWPDAFPINLPTAVTAFPAVGATAVQPGNGTSLLLNVANFTEVVGPLTGAGAVIGNQAGAFVGVNATSSFASGVVFKSTNGQNPSLYKLGTGTMTLSGVSDSTGQLQVAQGNLVLSGAGKTAFGENRALKGGTLTLDNAGTALNDRLGGNAKSLTPAGGTTVLTGNGATAVTENVNTLFNSSGASGPYLGGTGYTFLNVTPGAATTTLNATTFENFQSAGIALQRTGTWVLRSPTLGNLPGTYAAGTAQYAPAAGNLTNGLIQVQNPNFGSNAAFAITAAAITAQAGSSVVPTRPDYLGDTNAAGQGTGFVTQDSVTFPNITTVSAATTITLPNTAGLTVGQPVAGPGVAANTYITAVGPTSITLSAAVGTGAAGNVSVLGGVRLLAASEYAAAFPANANTNLNVKLSGNASATGDTRFQTLTMNPGSTVNISGTRPLDTSPSRLFLNNAGVLVAAGGAAATINGTPGTFLQSNTGTSLFLHAQGDLNLNATAFSDNGIVKTGAGTLNVGAGAFSVFRGTLEIDGGTVNLAAGNSFANIRGAGGFTTNANLYANAGTLNLNGNSQLVGSLLNNNVLPGMGGTITSATPATLTVLGSGTSANSQFSGTITGAVSLDKAGTGTAELYSDNPYSGTTLVRSGTLSLRDSGRLSGTTQVDLTYATLSSNNGYLSNVADRVNPAATVNMRGGSFNLIGAAGQTASQTLATVNLAAGRNDFNSNAGGSGLNLVSIGNLTRSAGSGAIVTFNQNYGFIGTAGSNTTAIRDLIGQINGGAVAPVNNILPAWIIVNGDHFAAYNATTGISFLSNTADGYANYNSTDLSTATAASGTLNYNDGTGRVIVAGAVVNAIRQAPGAAITNTLSGSLRINSGGLLTNANQNISFNPTLNATAPSLTSGTGELDVWINQGTTGINVPIAGAIDFVKSGPAGLNLNPNLQYNNTTANTVTSGSNAVTVVSTAGLAVGQPVTGTGVPAGATVAAITSGTTFNLSVAATATGANTLTFAAPNTYTGTTFVNSGTLSLNMVGADAATYVTVPGDLVIQNATATEGSANQLKTTANVTLTGSGRLNLVAAAGVTETIRSITFADAGGTSATMNIDRTASQPTSTLLLSGPTAITTNNTNPFTAPFVGAFTGNIGFTNAGGSIVNVNATTAANGLAGLGLQVTAQISTVPTGVAEGGLIKAGNGILALNPTNTTALAAGVTTSGSNTVTVTSTAGVQPGQSITGTGIPAGTYVLAVNNGTTLTLSANATAAGTALTFTVPNLSQFNNPTALTDVLNVSQGIVRADTTGALGNNFANTTVQSGAVLLGNIATPLLGSVTLKAGSTLGATINSTIFGAATPTAASQSLVNVAGNTTFVAADYFVQGTNNINLTLNGRLTGAGNINVVGPQVTGGAGLVQLGNPITSGTGSNDYTGTITVGTNTILRSQQALVAPAASITGNVLGAAAVNLAGGTLSLRDDFSTTNAVTTGLSATYGNNVTLSAPSFLEANRASALTTIVNNTINLGTLTVAAGTQSLAVTSGNGYRVGFASVDGPGTLVKAGQSILQLNSLAGTFSGNLAVAGPVGLNVAPAFNLQLTAATNAINTLTVAGAHNFTGGTANTVAGLLDVTANAGTVANGLNGVTSGATTGGLLIPNTATVTAGTLRNNGMLGSTGGLATVSATTITGGGYYQTVGQPLTLNGAFANDGATPTRIRVAGDNVVTLTTAGSTHTGGAEVNSGVLRLAPTAAAVNPLGTGGQFRVAGVPAVATFTQAVTAELRFDGGANAITQAGNITNSGLVRAASGTTTLAGIIGGPGAAAYVPGLLEGRLTGTTTAADLTGTRPANPGNFGLRSEPRLGQTNLVTQSPITGWGDNETWVYTGQMFDADGKFSFAENIDDITFVAVDGVVRLNNGTFNQVASSAFAPGQTTTASYQNAANSGNAAAPTDAFGMGPNGDGWHNIEIRFRNGTGGAGAVVGNGFFANYGFGLNTTGGTALDGTQYLRPIDPGDGSLFRTNLSAKGTIQVDSAATLTVNGFTQTSALTLAGGAGTATVNLAAALVSDADLVSVATAGTGNALITMVAGSTANIGTTIATGDVLAIPAGKTLTITGTSTGGPASIFRVGSAGTAATTLLNGGLSVTGGLALVNTAGGAGAVTGTVTTSGSGTLGGTGSITGALTSNGRVAPGEASVAGVLTVRNNVALGDNSGLEYNLVTPNAAAPAAGNDLLAVGNPTVGTSTLTLGQAVAVNVLGALAPGRYDLISYPAANALDAGSVANLDTWTLSTNGAAADPAAFDFLNDPTGGFVYLSVLTAVPEPGSAALLAMAGIGLLARRRRARR
jgi:autotransporter-associated beta strand protein